MKRCKTILFLIFLSSCSSLDRNGKKTRFTTTKAETEGCQYIKDVSAYPPFIGMNDWKIKLQNEAGRYDADLVYASRFFFFVAKGEAYKCKNLGQQKDTPQPGIDDQSELLR